jgi:hypothetical protein
VTETADLIPEAVGRQGIGRMKMTQVLLRRSKEPTQGLDA